MNFKDIINSSFSYRVITFATSIAPFFGTKINRENGFVEPEVLAILVCGCSFILFSLSFFKTLFTEKRKEYALFSWSIMMSSFNGILIYLNQAPDIHLYPILVLLVVAASFHSSIKGLLLSICSIYFISTAFVLVVSFPLKNNIVFFLIGETFLFVSLLFSKWKNIKDRQTIFLNNEMLEKQTADLEYINKEMDQFNYVLSHDLKKPLEAVKHLITISIQDIDTSGVKIPEDIRDNFNIITSRISQMENLIMGILEYSRAGNKKEKIWLSIPSEIDDVLEILEVPKNFRITISGPPLKIYYNQIELRQIIQNIISNAIKYNDKENGKMDINIIKIPTAIEINFKDYGMGIEEKNFVRIFDLMETLRFSNEYENSGIGLSIVKRIIEKNGGTVSVQSRKGEWTNFTIRFPVKDVSI